MSERSRKRYWLSPAHRDGDPSFVRAQAQEFPETPLLEEGVRLDRRGLMKGFAAVFASVGLAGCTRAPITKAIPLLVQPEGFTPGRSLWFATTCGACPAGCGVLAKVRDGRPIKLEGNPEHPLSKGGLCATGQASLLGLYDPARLRSPLVAGKASKWDEVDALVSRELEALRKAGGVRVLTATITSPWQRAAIERFLGRFADAKHVVYDPLSVAAILDAHQRTHGRRALPRYRFERARAIVSFDADFLGTWISPVEFTAGYRAGRSLEGEPPRLSWHAQLEGRLSLTGAAADRRWLVAPGQIGGAVAHLAARLLERAGEKVELGDLGKAPVDAKALDEIATRLWAARGEALVVCGLNDPATQTLVNLANHLLSAYGKTVDLDEPSRQLEGSDQALADLAADAAAGKVQALLVQGVNPVADAPGGAAFGKALGKIGLTVALASHLDETARACKVVAPVPHFLEAWGDAEPVAGVYSLTQPTVAPLGSTRSLVESLGRFSGDGRPDLETLRTSAGAAALPRQKKHANGQAFFDGSLQDGFAVLGASSSPGAAPPFDRAGVATSFRGAEPGAGKLALVLYPKVGLRDGRHATNPWLQELPDPITKAVWDNYACLSPATAKALGVANGSAVRLTGTPPGGAEVSLELPALVQPGQHDGVVAVALGYGRAGTERFASVGPRWLEAKPTTEEGKPVGVAAEPLLGLANGCAAHAGLAVTVTATGRTHPLAITQDHHSLAEPRELAMKGHETRPHARVLALPALEHLRKEGKEPDEDESLWTDDFKNAGPRWGMAIDLNACTGCGACVVSCQAENNVPVVGKDEVARHREMHWIRVDRYYAGEGDATEVVQQPVSCHHCANAPCETVCPVLATVHSKDGLNQQVYNRCVGTRYCANNCPYKTRRFNWFDYAHEDSLQNLVLNPDVTVRSRGVMEKCSLCVQRIQEAKVEAKRAGVPVPDGAIQTACQQSCPARAIVFGNLADPTSEVSKRVKDARAYHLLGEIGVAPSVGYLAKVRNHEGGEGGHRVG